MTQAIKRPVLVIRIIQVLRRYDITKAFNLLLFGLIVTLITYLI